MRDWALNPLIKRGKLDKISSLNEDGVPGGIRTHGLKIRNLRFLLLRVFTGIDRTREYKGF